MTSKTDKDVLDINKLTPAQLEIAIKVGTEAQRQGIDPDYAIAIAFAESRFNPNARSPKDAFGVMQLIPGTAKDMGVNRENVDQNIQGGIKYLKKQLDRYDGDKTRAAIAYNAGPDSTFFKTGDINTIPEESRNYVFRINKNHSLAGDQPSQEVVPQGDQTAQQPAQAPAQPAAQPVAQPAAEQEPVDRDIETGLPIVPKERQAEPAADRPIPEQTEQPGKSTDILTPENVAKGIGALGGASTTAAIELGVPVLRARSNIINALSGSGYRDANAPLQRMGRRGLDAYIKSQFPENHRIFTRELEESANRRARAANPRAEPIRIRTMAEAQREIDLIQGKPPERVPKVIPQTGRAIYREVPGRPATDISRYIDNPSTPIRNAVVSRPVSSVANFARNVAPSLSRIAVGGLGGFGAVSDFNEAIRLARDPEYGPYNWRTASKGIGALGNAMMLAPGFQAPGAALSTAGYLPEAVDLGKKAKDSTLDYLYRTGALRSEAPF
jgi:hypothetical protein